MFYKFIRFGNEFIVYLGDDYLEVKTICTGVNSGKNASYIMFYG